VLTLFHLLLLLPLVDLLFVVVPLLLFHVVVVVVVDFGCPLPLLFHVAVRFCLVAVVVQRFDLLRLRC